MGENGAKGLIGLQRRFRFSRVDPSSQLAPNERGIAPALPLRWCACLLFFPGVCLGRRGKGRRRRRVKEGGGEGDLGSSSPPLASHVFALRTINMLGSSGKSRRKIETKNELFCSSFCLSPVDPKSRREACRSRSLLKGSLHLVSTQLCMSH